jgi:hypothetical protein
LDVAVVVADVAAEEEASAEAHPEEAEEAAMAEEDLAEAVRGTLAVPVGERDRAAMVVEAGSMPGIDLVAMVEVEPAQEEASIRADSAELALETEVWVVKLV